jgi:nitrite reductase (NADH) small subunit
MSEFVRICSKAELPEPGMAKEVGAGTAAVCVANVNGEISAMDNSCPHRQGPLGQGTIEGGKVVCPWHAWAFDVKTGSAAHNPSANVQIYEVKIEGDDVLARM